MSDLNIILKHVWSEPRVVAEIEWNHNQPDPLAQLLGQVGWGRREMERFAAGGGWPDPDAEVDLSKVEWPAEPPDWDWWEPRHDQPWRRQAARDRELDALLEALDDQ